MSAVLRAEVIITVCEACTSLLSTTASPCVNSFLLLLIILKTGSVMLLRASLRQPLCHFIWKRTKVSDYLINDKYFPCVIKVLFHLKCFPYSHVVFDCLENCCFKLWKGCFCCGFGQGLVYQTKLKRKEDSTCWMIFTVGKMF